MSVYESQRRPNDTSRSQLKSTSVDVKNYLKDEQGKIKTDMKKVGERTLKFVSKQL